MVTHALTRTRCPFPALPTVPKPDWPQIWSRALEDPAWLTSLLKRRRLINHGTFGAVYSVSGAAIKVGLVTEEEVERQKWVYETYQRALPVWAYKPRLMLPEAISSLSCPVHYMDLDEESWSCHCSEPMDVMVMPLAEDACETWFDRSTQKVINPVVKGLCEQFDFFWDNKPSNLLRWNGRLVLADFGDYEVDWW